MKKDKNWVYISGSGDYDSSVQISPNRRWLLIKNYESTKDGVKRWYEVKFLGKIKTQDIQVQKQLGG